MAKDCLNLNIVVGQYLEQSVLPKQIVKQVKMKVKKNMKYRKYNYEYSNRAKNNITID